MSKGRKALPVQTPVDVKLNEEALARAGEAAETMAVIGGVSEDVFAMGVDIGRLEALDFMATVANSALVSIYDNVKKSKAWQHLRNPKSGDGRHFESLEEFCEVKLGKSYRRMRELSSNRRMIGADAYEQAEKIGLRQVDYNAIRALPEERQDAIREALADGAELAAVQDALRSLAIRDQADIDQLTRERDAAAAERDDALGKVAAREKLISAKDEVVNALRLQLHQYGVPDDEGRRAQVERAGQLVGQIVFQIRDVLHTALDELVASYGGTPNAPREIMAGLVGQIRREQLELSEWFGLPDIVGDGRPEWMRGVEAMEAEDAAREAAAAAAAGDGEAPH